MFETMGLSPRFYADSFAPEGAAIVSTVDSSRAALSLSGRIVIMKTSNGAHLIGRRDGNYNFRAYARGYNIRNI